jgi:hypothetical protein
MAGKDGINCGGAGVTKVTRMSKPKFLFGYYFLLPNVPRNVSYLAVCGFVILVCMRPESLRVKCAAKPVDPVCERGAAHAIVSAARRGPGRAARESGGSVLVPPDLK